MADEDVKSKGKLIDSIDDPKYEQNNDKRRMTGMIKMIRMTR